MAAGDEILAWKKAAAAQPPEERTDCPECDWPLDKLANGTLWCKFCGYTWPEKLRRRSG